MAATKPAKHQSLPFQLSLRIRHPSVDPATISKELRIEPEHAFRAGQPRPLRSGMTPATVHFESYWLAALNPATWFASASFAGPPNLNVAQKHIDAAVTHNLAWALSICAVRLSRGHGTFLHTLRSEGGEASLLVALSPAVVSSFSLAPEVSRIFGELGITLEFEITND
jgi:hypothetical protein